LVFVRVKADTTYYHTRLGVTVDAQDNVYGADFLMNVRKFVTR
jgi:hypothetical protein